MRTEFDMRPSSKTSRTYPSALQQLFGLAVPTQDAATQSTKNFTKLLKYCKTKDDMKIFHGQNTFSDSADSLAMMKFDCGKYEENEPKLFKIYCSKRHSRPYEKIKITKTISDRPLFYKMYCSRPKYIKNKSSDFSMDENWSNLFKKRKTKKCFCICKHFFGNDINKLKSKRRLMHSDHESSGNLKIHLEKSDTYDESTTIIVPKKREKFTGNPVELSPWKKMMLMSAVGEDRFLHPDIPQGVKKPDRSKQSVKNYYSDTSKRKKYSATESDDSSSISKLTESSVDSSGYSRKKGKTTKERSRKAKKKPEQEREISSGLVLQDERLLINSKNESVYKPDITSGLVLENKRPVKKFKNESESVLNDLSLENVKKPTNRRDEKRSRGQIISEKNLNSSSSEGRFKEKPIGKKPSERSNPVKKQRDPRNKDDIESERNRSRDRAPSRSLIRDKRPQTFRSTSRDRISDDKLSRDEPQSSSRPPKRQIRDREPQTFRSTSRDRLSDDKLSGDEPQSSSKPPKRQIRDREPQTFRSTSRDRISDDKLSRDNPQNSSKPSRRQIRDREPQMFRSTSRDRITKSVDKLSRDDPQSSSQHTPPRRQIRDRQPQTFRSTSRDRLSDDKLSRDDPQSSTQHTPPRRQIRDREPQTFRSTSRDRISGDKLSSNRDKEPQQFRSTSRDKIAKSSSKDREPQTLRSSSRDKLTKQGDKFSQNRDKELQKFRILDYKEKSDDKLSSSRDREPLTIGTPSRNKIPNDENLSQNRNREPQNLSREMEKRDGELFSNEDKLQRSQSRDKIKNDDKLSKKRDEIRDNTRSSTSRNKPTKSDDNLTQSRGELPKRTRSRDRFENDNKKPQKRYRSRDRVNRKIKNEDKSNVSNTGTKIDKKSPRRDKSFRSHSRDRINKNNEKSEKSDPVVGQISQNIEGERGKIEDPNRKRSSLLKNEVRDTTDPKLLRLENEESKSDDEKKLEATKTQDESKLRNHIVVTHLGQGPKEHVHPYSYEIPKDAEMSVGGITERKSPTRQELSERTQPENFNLNTKPHSNTKENDNPFNYPVPKMSSVPKTVPKYDKKPDSQHDVQNSSNVRNTKPRNINPIPTGSFRPQPPIQYKSEQKFADKSVQTTGIIMDYHESRIFADTGRKPNQDAKIGVIKETNIGAGSGDNSSSENTPRKKKLRRGDIYHDQNRERKPNSTLQSRKRGPKSDHREDKKGEKIHKRMRDRTKDSKRSRNRDRDKSKASRGDASNSSRERTDEKPASRRKGSGSRERKDKKPVSRGKASSRGRKDNKQHRRKAKSSNTSKSRESSKKRRKSKKKQRKDEIFECICTPIESKEHFEIDCILVDESVKKTKMDKCVVTELTFNCQFDLEDTKQFSPFNYSLSKKDVKEKYGNSVPPFWVLFDNLISVVWALNNPSKRGPGIVHLNWALEFLRSTEENGKFVEPIGCLIKAIEIDIMKRYCDLKKMHMISLYGQS